MAAMMVSHNVFLTLNDRSPEGRRRCVEACQTYLTEHPGTVSIAIGTLADDIQWDVSDRDFDVSVSILFRDRIALDEYLESPRHEAFLEKHAAEWTRLRCFDAYVEGSRG